MNKINPNENKRRSSFELKDREESAQNVVNENRQDDDENIPKGKFTFYLLACLLIATFGSGFQFGWSIAIFNTPSDVIKEFYRQVYREREGKEMTNDQLNTYWSITNGLLPLGGVFGGLSSGFAADKFGRKNGLILINTFVIISTVLGIISKPLTTYYTIFVSKFFSGVYTGLFSGLLPLYLNECASSNLRGFVGTFNQFSIVIGILVTNVIGLPQLLGTDALWPYLVGLTLVPAIVHIGLFFTSESPKYMYINKNNPNEAKEILIKFREGDMELVDYEMNALRVEKEARANISEATWSSLFNEKTLLRPLIVTIGIQISQQFSGINAVIFYSTDIFRSAGLEGDWPIYGTIILGVVQIVMTFICMLLIERAGRKLLLLIGLAGMCIFSFLLALFRILGEDGEQWLNYMTVVCAVAYIVFFSIGPGAIPWLITSELFGSDSRGKATSVAVFVNWLSNFIVTVTFPFIEEAIGSYSFIIFGGLLVGFFIFVFLMVPETKNRPIEQIMGMFERKFVFTPKGN